MVDLVKAVVGLGLLLCLALAASARPPRRPAASRDLRALLGAVAVLYAAAVAAFAAHRVTLAEAACAAGVAGAALAGWLSRRDDDEPGGGDPAPDGAPVGGDGVDWERFDRERRRWDRPRAPSTR